MANLFLKSRVLICNLLSPWTQSYLPSSVVLSHNIDPRSICFEIEPQSGFGLGRSIVGILSDSVGTITIESVYMSDLN